MREVDAAWAAGLFEGEGSVQVGNHGVGINITLAMTDPEPVRKFAGITGAKVYGPYERRQENHSAVWRASLYGHAEMVQDLLLHLKPHLCSRRILQIEGAIDRARAPKFRVGELICDQMAQTNSPNGYSKHWRRGEKACEVCLASRRRYYQERRSKT